MRGIDATNEVGVAKENRLIIRYTLYIRGNAFCTFD